MCGLPLWISAKNDMGFEEQAKLLPHIGWERAQFAHSPACFSPGGDLKSMMDRGKQE
jgi:hypothetical protein